VLFFAANPAGTKPLQLDEEIRQITAKIRAAEYRDSLELISRWAVRPDDVTQALLEVKPHIVHFSGHGNSSEELILLDDLGKLKPVSKEALVHLFSTLKDNVRLVVFNACSTKPQAVALSKVIDCVVGMNEPVGDEASFTFAASFYRAVGFGRTVKEAFELGRSALLMAGIPEAKTPRLSVRKGVDAETTVLVSPPVTKKSVEMGTTANSISAAALSAVDRAALVRTVSGLSPSDMALLVTLIEGAADQVGHRGTVREQAAELIRWAASTRGPGLAAVEEALANFR
jgi:hypothetical protein